MQTSTPSCSAIGVFEGGGDLDATLIYVLTTPDDECSEGSCDALRLSVSPPALSTLQCYLRADLCAPQRGSAVQLAQLVGRYGHGMS